MATAETVTWEDNVARAPKEEERQIFKQIAQQLQDVLELKVKEDKKHDIGSVIPVEDLTKKELRDFSVDDLVEVRIGKVDYGRLLFGKVLIPATEKGYFHFRYNITKETEPRIHTEKETEAGKPKFAAIFEKKDPLEFFAY